VRFFVFYIFLFGIYAFWRGCYVFWVFLCF